MPLQYKITCDRCGKDMGTKDKPPPTTYTLRGNKILCARCTELLISLKRRHERETDAFLNGHELEDL